MKPVVYQQQLLEQIGMRLYAIRHTKRLKMVTVAREIGISHPVISKIENGRYKALSVGLLCKIADHYKMSMEHIVFGMPPAELLSAAEVVDVLKAENKYLKEKLEAFLSGS